MYCIVHSAWLLYLQSFYYTFRNVMSLVVENSPTLSLLGCTHRRFSPAGTEREGGEKQWNSKTLQTVIYIIYQNECALVLFWLSVRVCAVFCCHLGSRCSPLLSMKHQAGETGGQMDPTISDIHWIKMRCVRMMKWPYNRIWDFGLIAQPWGLVSVILQNNTKNIQGSHKFNYLI